MLAHANMALRPLVQFEYVCYSALLQCRSISTHVEVSSESGLSCRLPEGVVRNCRSFSSSYSLLYVSIVVHPYVHNHLS